MTTNNRITRRTAAGLLLSAAFVLGGRRLRAEEATAVKVYKESTCGCCGIWARHMSKAGFSVTTVDVPDVDAIKAQFGIPARLQTCHTAEVGGYLVEGHVPASIVKRLLAEKPNARGIAVPGMPAGSPGMENVVSELYEVILFSANGMSVYARCRGSQEV